MMLEIAEALLLYKTVAEKAKTALQEHCENCMHYCTVVHEGKCGDEDCAFHQLRQSITELKGGAA